MGANGKKDFTGAVGLAFIGCSGLLGILSGPFAKIFS